MTWRSPALFLLIVLVGGWLSRQLRVSTLLMPPSLRFFVPSLIALLALSLAARAGTAARRSQPAAPPATH
jgi:hypothetical protein